MQYFIKLVGVVVVQSVEVVGGEEGNYVLEIVCIEYGWFFMDFIYCVVFIIIYLWMVVSLFFFGSDNNYIVCIL